MSHGQIELKGSLAILVTDLPRMREGRAREEFKSLVCCNCEDWLVRNMHGNLAGWGSREE